MFESVSENCESDFGPYKRHQRLKVNIFNYLIIVVNEYTKSITIY